MRIDLFLSGLSAYKFSLGAFTKIFDSGSGAETFDILPFTTSSIWVAGSAAGTVQLYYYAGSSWTQYLSTVAGAFSCLAGIASNDIWAGGCSGLLGSNNPPMMYHWDGLSWSVSSLPAISGTNGTIYDIFALNSTHVYAVGIRPASSDWLMFYWNGSTWTEIPHGAYNIFNLTVYAADATHVYIGGGYAGLGYIVKYDGSNFTLFLGPYTYGWTPRTINTLFGFNNNDMWLGCNASVSTDGIIAHWDGVDWTSITVPVTGYKMNWHGIWGNATDDVYIAGSSTDNSSHRTILHWDGANLSSVYNGTESTTTSFHQINGLAVSGQNIALEGISHAVSNCLSDIAPHIYLAGISMSLSTCLSSVSKNINLHGLSYSRSKCLPSIFRNIGLDSVTNKTVSKCSGTINLAIRHVEYLNELVIDCTTEELVIEESL